MTPEVNRPIDRETISKTAWPSRRTVRFALPPDPHSAEEPTRAERIPAPRAPANARRPASAAKDRWLRLAETVVGDWAPTLREALLRVIVFAVVLVVLGVALSGVVAVLGAVAGSIVFLVGRRRVGSRR